MVRPIVIDLETSTFNNEVAWVRFGPLQHKKNIGAPYLYTAAGIGQLGSY